MSLKHRVIPCLLPIHIYHPLSFPPSLFFVFELACGTSALFTICSLLCSIKSMLTKGQDPTSIDCAGSNHITGDLWPLRPLRLSAWECSCGKSWHSSPLGQDTISLHCKECERICNDNNNLWWPPSLIYFLPNGRALVVWKTKVIFLDPRLLDHCFLFVELWKWWIVVKTLNVKLCESARL